MKIIIIIVIGLLAIAFLIICAVLIYEAVEPFYSMHLMSLKTKFRPRIKQTIRTVVENTDSADLDSDDVYYYEPDYDPALNKMISRNILRLKRMLLRHHKNFMYLPAWKKEFDSKQFFDSVEYTHPGLDSVISADIDKLTYSSILSTFNLPDDIKYPSLIRFMGEKDGIKFFCITQIESRKLHKFKEELKYYLDHCRIIGNEENEEGIFYMCIQSADDQFDDEMYRLGREIRDRVNLLRAKGLSSVAIKTLVGYVEDKPGRLVIDRNNRITLPDYGNREIKLSPLHKAVFFLFLKHPEGIYFKDLKSYGDELKELYLSITGREDLDAIDESIAHLIDPWDNSINEKCARIKNAFVSEFREEVARWYFIDGRKGEKKLIRLPRELLTWER